MNPNNYIAQWNYAEIVCGLTRINEAQKSYYKEIQLYKLKHQENEENQNKNDNNGYLQLHIEFGIFLMNSIEDYKNGLKRFKYTCFMLEIEVEHGKMTVKMLQLKRSRRKERRNKHKQNIPMIIIVLMMILFKLFRCFLFILFFVVPSAVFFWIVDGDVSCVRQDALYIQLQQLALILSVKVLIAASC